MKTKSLRQNLGVEHKDQTTAWGKDHLWGRRVWEN